MHPFFAESLAQAEQLQKKIHYKDLAQQSAPQGYPVRTKDTKKKIGTEK